MKAFLDFIFPSFCLHCDEKISKPPFCLNCMYYLLLSSSSTVIFEKNPVTDLYLKYLKKYQFSSHIKTVAAYAVLKLDDLDWPFPDIITGDSYLTLSIAKQLSCFLNRKFRKKPQINKGKTLQIKDLTKEKEGYTIFLLMI